MPEKYTFKEQQEILKILNKDRGKCIYCNNKLSMFDSIATGNVCEKCVKRNYMKAMGRY